MTEAPAGYGVLRPLWGDEIGTSNAAQSVTGGPEVGLRLLRVTVPGRAERRRLRGACLAVTVLTPHAGILTVHEAGFTADDHPFLVTDLPRDNLARRLAADGPLDVPTAAAIGQSLAATLGAAHARGILHQDVRPGTVVWAAGQAPLLADFGMAQAALAVGAADLSPEALVHAAREVFGWETAGPAADVHGLASTIYTMLAGQPPYQAEALLGRAALYQRVLRGAPKPLPAPGVPARLSALLADMMAPDPGSRPALPEVMDALAELAAPGPAARAAAWASPAATASDVGMPGTATPENPIAAALAPPGSIVPQGAAPREAVSGSPATGTASHDSAPPEGRLSSEGGPGTTVGEAGAASQPPARRTRSRSRYVPLALLLAIGVIALLAGVVWGVVTAPGSAPARTAVPAGSPGGTAVVPVSGAQQASYRPRQVTVAPDGAGIRVSWSAPSVTIGISAYIAIAERGGEPAQEKTLAPSGRDAVFTGLPHGQRYCFVVGSLLEAAAGQPETAAAAPACATVQP